MSDKVFWIEDAQPHRLAMMPRPRSTEEIRNWRTEGLDTIVCLLAPEEIEELDLQDEGALCESLGMEFVAYPMRDRGLPTSYRATATLVDALVAKLRAGKSVGIHCRVGIGRSGLISACVLLRLGIPYPNVFTALSRSRGLEVPDTMAQAHWVRIFALGDFPED